MKRISQLWQRRWVRMASILALVGLVSWWTWQSSFSRDAYRSNARAMTKANRLTEAIETLQDGIEFHSSWPLSSSETVQSLQASLIETYEDAKAWAELDQFLDTVHFREEFYYWSVVSAYYALGSHYFDNSEWLKSHESFMRAADRYCDVQRDLQVEALWNAALAASNGLHVDRAESAIEAYVAMRLASENVFSSDHSYKEFFSERAWLAPKNLASLAAHIDSTTDNFKREHFIHPYGPFGEPDQP